MEIVEIITKYGLEVGLIALVSIFLVGLVKLIFTKPLKKIEKSNRKPLYEVLSMLFAYGLSAAWLAVRVAWFGLDLPAFSWELVLSTGSMVYVTVKVLYPLYENYKIRDFFQLIGRWVLSWFKKKTPTKTATAQDTTNSNNNINGPITL